MKQRNNWLSGAAVAALSLSAPVALAQDQGGEDAVSIQDEILVTGKYLYASQVQAVKTPTPIIDVPQSLSIVTEDQIEQRGFSSIGEIVTYTPGVNMSQGEGHRDAVVFRGVRSTADFFIDGVRDDVQYYRPLYNLSQVEILRGPNALLFGRGGTGGVINRVTKKGVVGEQFNDYRVSLDTFGGYSAQLDSNVSTTDTSAFRVNALYESLENHRDFYDGDRIGVNPTARFKLSPATTLDLSYEYVDHERFIDRGIPTGSDGEPVEAFEDIVFGDPDLNTHSLEAHLLRATLQHRFNDTLKGNVGAAYGDYDKFYQNFYASAYDQAAAPDRVGLDGYVDTTQRQNLIVFADLVGEFQTGGIGHTLITGIEVIDTRNDNDRFNAFWSGSADDVEVFEVMRPLALRGGVGVNADGEPTRNDFTADLNDRTEADINVVSAFVQDQIALGDQVDLVLGARYDRFEIDVFDVKAAESRSRTDENVSPRLGLIYKPRENVSLYASYSETFLPRSGEQFATIDDQSRALDPDEFESAEIGLKWDFTDRLGLTAAYFQNEETRAARDDATGEGFEVRGLEVDGFEVQLQGQPTDRLFVTAGYSYLDGETDGGDEIPRELPENTFSAWTAYQLTDRFGLGLGLTYQDESFITDKDVGATGPHPTLPAFTRVDAAAYYDVSERLRIQLNIENLTDELYFPNSHSTHQATVAAPLNARLTLSGRF